MSIVLLLALALVSPAHAPLFPHPCVVHDRGLNAANASLAAPCVHWAR